MDKLDVQKINSIIHWLKEIKNISDFLMRTNMDYFQNCVLEKKYILKYIGRIRESKIELDEEMFLFFYQWLKEYKLHLEKLVEKSDRELVEIAKAVIAGEFKI